MDSVLNEHFPPEIARVIFSYSSLRQDLQRQRRRLRSVQFRIRPYNYYFFRNYYYLMEQIPPGEDHMWVPTPSGGLLVFRL